MQLLARSHIAALTQFNMTVLVIAVLMWLGLFSVELVYILMFIGLLVTVHLLEPVGAEPKWYSLMKWLSRLGFIGLGYMVFQRVAMVLGL